MKEERRQTEDRQKKSERRRAIFSFLFFFLKEPAITVIPFSFVPSGFELLLSFLLACFVSRDRESRK